MGSESKVTHWKEAVIYGVVFFAFSAYFGLVTRYIVDIPQTNPLLILTYYAGVITAVGSIPAGISWLLYAFYLKRRDATV